jgi:hypothetical protein
VIAALIGYGLLVNPYSGGNGIPCLWKALFGVECPGCGLSRAGAFLVRGELSAAVHQNWLIIPVVLLLAVHFVMSYHKSAHNNNPQNKEEQHG